MYGNIDSTANALYISYTTRVINSLQIICDPYMYTVGNYNLRMSVLPATANNIATKEGRPDIAWSIDASANRYASFHDATNGVLTVSQLADASLKEKFTVTLTVNLMNGSTITATKQVSFYRRLPEIGDFAYADGTFDNVYDETKDLVGWVYHRTKESDTEYKLLVENNGDLSIPDSSGNYIDGFPWGLYPDSNATNGFPTEIGTAITNATGLASAFDTDVPNITSVGNPGGANAVDDYYLDDTQEDGYAVIESNRVMSDWNGKNKTDLIVNHAQKIILNYLDLPLPTTLDELGSMAGELVSANDSQTKYRQFFYLPAYGCSLYEPPFENLHEQYKKGNWYLPAGADECRLYNFHHNSRGRSTSNSVSMDYADEDPDYPARLPLYANLMKRVKDAGGSTTKIKLHSASYFWTSTEYYSYNTWPVYFGSGNVITYNKYYTFRVRAVAAFRFTL